MALRRSETIFDQLRDELIADHGRDQFDAGMRLLAAIEQRYGPVPLRPVW